MIKTVSTRKKTRITLLLALFIVCILSSNVFAAYVAKIGTKKFKTMQSAVNAAKTGQTIKVLGNINTAKTVTISSKKITIDFAKKKYTCRLTDGSAFNLNSGQLTLKNANINSKYFAVDVRSGAKLIVDNGTVNGTIMNTGNLVIHNGTFKGSGMIMYGDDEEERLCAAVENHGKCTIENGTFSGKNRPVIHNSGTAVIRGGKYTETNTEKYVWYIMLYNDGNLRIDGGSFSGKIYNETLYKNQLLITGGTFKGGTDNALKNAKGRAIITGGSFSSTDTPAVYNAYDDEIYTYGLLVITDGTFKSTGNNGTVSTESELVITGGTFLLNGKKKGAIRLNVIDDDISKCIIPARLGLKVNDQ